MKRILPFVIHAILLTAILVLAFFPVISQTRHAPAGTVYPAIDGLLGDYYWYLSVMNQGRIQSYEINQYSTQNAGGPSYLHLYYLLLGAVGQIFTIGNPLMYHLSVAAAIILAYAATVMIARTLLPGRWVYLAVAFAFFSTPLSGAVATLFRQQPSIISTGWTRLDLYNKLTQAPHHWAGISLTLMATALLFTYQKTRRLSRGILAAAVLAAGNMFFSIPGFAFTVAFLPFFAATAATALGLTKKLPPALARFVTPFTVSGVMPGYTVILAVSAVTLVLSYVQVLVLGFPWSEIIRWETIIFGAERYPTMFPVLVAAIGIYWLLVIPAAIRILRRPTPQWLFILILFTLPFLFYLAASYNLIRVNKARFVLACLPFTLGFLSTAAVREGTDLLRRRWLKTAFVAVVAATAILYPVTEHLRTYWIPLTDSRPYFTNMAIPLPYWHAMDYLETHVPRYTGIITSFPIGMFVPAFTHMNVLIGQEIATDNFWSKKAFTDMLYAGSCPNDLLHEVVKKTRNDYLLWDAPGDPTTLYPGYFSGPVFTDGYVRMYRILPLP
jgi:hypothetical protein